MRVALKVLKNEDCCNETLILIIKYRDIFIAVYIFYFFLLKFIKGIFRAIPLILKIISFSFQSSLIFQYYLS